MSKVSSLIGNRPVVAPGDPQPNVIALLEDLLEQARDGYLQGVAVACTSADGHSWSQWSSSYHASGVRMLGSITILQRDYARDM